jgi:uncharacterized protein YegJ (DUF2314 family)
MTTANVIGFVDGVAYNNASPLTFSIPSKAEKDALKPGQYVKIGFVTDSKTIPNTERMWVKVHLWDGEHGQGELNNDPVVANMKDGDTVKFEAKHILDIFD